MDSLFPNSPQDNPAPKPKHPGGRPIINGRYIGRNKKYAAYESKWDRKQRSQAYKRRLKTKVFAHYSHSAIPFCACCGEDNLEFLTIDHINGDGAQHRKTLPSNGRNTLYTWLFHNNYPEGFRVLCYNCNCARGFYGYCPHEKVREKQLLLMKL